MSALSVPNASLPDSPLAERAREIALRLTGWPSVTGTRDEAAFPLRLMALLRESSYFTQNPENIEILPIEGDALGRSNLLAVVRGRGPKTVVLSGHFDTVAIDDYGDLARYAGSPYELRTRLIERLEAAGTHPQALTDFRSGDFLPGRGLLDMKSGIAAGIAVLEAFADDPDRKGNLLLVATPDEEDRSAGMRSVAALLPDWLRRRGLNVELGINLDALCDNAEGAAGRVVAFGCIGKLLLSAYVVGKESHAAYPHDGVNAAYLAAELATELEAAPELAEDEDGELAAPPTVLGSRDLKSAYNVTTPGVAWAFWNVLIHRRTPAEVLAIAKRLARNAADRAARRMAVRARRLKVATSPTPAWDRVAILTFADLAEAARARTADFDARFAALAESLAADAGVDLPSRTRQLVEATWAMSGFEGPAIVLGFGAMPYPAVAWPEGKTALQRKVADAASETAERFGVSIGTIRYFPAIADMSFIGPIDTAALAEAARNTPLWGSSIRWDLSTRATPGFPLVNIGPWGRDYHHWLERVHAPYAFETLPALIEATVRRVLA